MPDDNRISAALADTAVTAINAAITDIRAKLPFLVSLTNEERSKMLKLGDGRLALDEDAHALMGDHPDFIPNFVDMAELEKDRALRAKVDEIRLALEALLNDIEGTEMLLGSEMLQAYLAFYSTAKEGAKRGAVGAQAVVDVLSKYFARTGKPAAPAKNG
jgi:hypothetical protein